MNGRSWSRWGSRRDPGGPDASRGEPEPLAPVSNPEILDALAHGARVLLISREGCHLCHEALNLVAETCCPGEWASVDVDDHPALQERYSDHVPVVFVDGRLLSYWTLSREQLTDALAGGDWVAPPRLDGGNR